MGASQNVGDASLWQCFQTGAEEKTKKHGIWSIIIIITTIIIIILIITITIIINIIDTLSFYSPHTDWGLLPG